MVLPTFRDSFFLSSFFLSLSLLANLQWLLPRKSRQSPSENPDTRIRLGGFANSGRIGTAGRPSGKAAAAAAENSQ